jgi:hypothetical protein
VGEECEKNMQLQDISVSGARTNSQKELNWDVASDSIPEHINREVPKFAIRKEFE